METAHTLLLVLQVLVSVALIGFVLIQHGKGADAGAAFGSGASATVFGSQGSGNFLTKTTTVLAFIFLANSLLLGYLSAHPSENNGSLLDQESTVLESKPAEKPAEETAQGTSSDIPVDISKDIEESKLSDMPAEAPADTGDKSTDAPASDVPEVPNQ